MGILGPAEMLGPGQPYFWAGDHVSWSRLNGSEADTWVSQGKRSYSGNMELNHKGDNLSEPGDHMELGLKQRTRIFWWVTGEWNRLKLQRSDSKEVKSRVSIPNLQFLVLILSTLFLFLCVNKLEWVPGSFDQIFL